MIYWVECKKQRAAECEKQRNTLPELIMSIYGALRAGVSGLSVQAQAIGIVSDNIANVNTNGYKRVSTRFASFVINQDNQSFYTPGGATIGNVRENGEQGLLAAARASTDLAVSGTGFFTVTDKLEQDAVTGEWIPTGQVAYTRSGQFRPDREGNLRNAEGQYLLAWERLGSNEGAASLDADALFRESNRADSLRGVNVAKASYPPVETSLVDVGVNLNADTDINPLAPTATPAGTGVTPETFDYELSTNVIDKQGNRDTVTMRFVKTGLNVWQVHLVTENFSLVEGAAINRDTREITGGNISAIGGGIGQGATPADRFHFATLTFDAAGILQDVSLAGLARGDNQAAASGILTVFLDPDGDANVPAAPYIDDKLAIDIDFGTLGSADGFSHFFATSSTPKYLDQNGKAFSSLSGVSFSENGTMEALFANGEARALYKVPLATFTNPNGLRARSGNIFLETEQSGRSLLREATLGGAGSVIGSAIEQSAVDLAAEFSDMIVYQRAYAANTKIITTADQMLEELIRAKR